METNPQAVAEAQVDHVVSKDAGQVWPVPTLENKPEELDWMNKTAGQVEKLDARSLGINIHNCGACDGSHECLQVNEYARPLAPFTHWFMCPNTHDPVNLTLGMMKSGEGLEFHAGIIQDLAKAQIAGRYMVIVCYVDADKDAERRLPLRLVRHSCKFPTGDVYPSKESEGFVGLLMRNLKEEFGDPQPVEMKTVAPHPLKSLLGRAAEAAVGSADAMHPLPPQ